MHERGLPIKTGTAFARVPGGINVLYFPDSLPTSSEVVILGEEELTRWLEKPNSAFDGSTPLQVIERGETDRLWRTVHELESGEPN